MNLISLTPEEKVLLSTVGGRVLITLLHGSFSYASARDLARRDSQAIAHRDVVIYDFTHAGYVDPSAALAIDEMIDLSLKHDRHVIVSGLKSHALRALSGMGVLDRISVDQQFEDRKDAIAAAVALLSGEVVTVGADLRRPEGLSPFILLPTRPISRMQKSPALSGAFYDYSYRENLSRELVVFVAIGSATLVPSGLHHGMHLGRTQFTAFICIRGLKRSRIRAEALAVEFL